MASVHRGSASGFHWSVRGQLLCSDHELVELGVLGRVDLAITDAKRNGDGRSVYLVASASGWRLPMFAPDILALLFGTATITQIVQRNLADDLGDSWPTLSLPRASMAGVAPGLPIERVR